MKRLSGLDASFLYLQTDSCHLHVTGLVVVDPSDTAGGLDRDELAETLATRLARVPVLQRRLAFTPGGLDHPYWIEAGDYDPRDHIRTTTLSGPDPDGNLQSLAAGVASIPLSLDKPLWELWVIDGLERGRLAFLLKAHHAVMDGSAGVALMTAMFDLTPDGSRDAGEARHEPPPAEVAPGPVEMLTRAALRTPQRLLQTVATAAKTARALPEALVSGLGSADSDRGPTIPGRAPSTPLNRAITPERSVALTTLPLDVVRRARGDGTATINDVVLSACAGSLREYLGNRGGIPDGPLVASVPVAKRDSCAATDGGNDLSVNFVGLPVDIADRSERLATVARDSAAAKSMQQAAGSELLGEWAEIAPPGLLSLAARAFSNLRLADLTPPVHNGVVSNVRGPDFELYSAGARVEAVYPLGPVMDGAALNITVFSYAGRLHIGVVGCRRALPDPERIADGIVAEIEALAELRAQPAATKVRRARALPARRPALPQVQRAARAG